MRNDKENAFALRAKGRSFNEISDALSVPKSTLSHWFKNDHRSAILTTINRTKMQQVHTARLKKMNEARAVKLKLHYENAVAEAQQEYKKYRHDPLFVAGLMLYAGEGDKGVNGKMIRIANVDSGILRVFMTFSRKYLRIPMKNIKFWMLLYPNLDEAFCREKWKSELSLSEENFYKTQVIQGRSLKRKLLYGVGNITITGKYNRVKLIEWIRLCLNDLIENNAGMV